MDTTESILTSVKKLLGIDESYTHFDADLIMHINSVFSILGQMGVGPKKGFAISGADEKWSDFLEDVRLLLTRVSRDRATGERLTEDPGGSGFSRFLNIATTIGMLFMGVMVVKYGDSLMPGRLTELLPHGAVLALSLLATLACMGVVLFQLATVRLAGAVTLSQPFISQIVLLKRTYFALAVIVTSPVLLLFALCPRGTGGVWFCIIVIELIVTAILYLREVLNLFISKKVSILHWILYLCIVEVFPVSLLWLLVAR